MRPKKGQLFLKINKRIVGDIHVHVYPPKLMLVLVLYYIHSETGQSGNRWSLVTYRIGMYMHATFNSCALMHASITCGCVRSRRGVTIITVH